MPVADNKPLEMAERRVKVAAMYLCGKSFREIGRALQVHWTTIAEDLKAIHAEWKESRLADYDQKMDRELAKIDRLEAVAWEAWERSCKDAETLHTSNTSGRTAKDGAILPDLARTNHTIKGQSGNPSFLERVAWCIERRCKLLRLDGLEMGKADEPLTLDERRRRLTAVIDTLRRRAESLGNGAATNGSN